MTSPLELGLLHALGYAVFERVGLDSFSLCGDPPGWLGLVSRAGANSASLSDLFPFLQVFMLDAQEFWCDPKNRQTLRSDYWTQTTGEEQEIHLSASAVQLNERSFLLIGEVDEQFREAQAQVHHSHQTLLDQQRIAKLSRELQRATAAKSEFVARMSHEIRTPMNALLGAAELLSETQLNSEQREYLRVFRRTGDNLLKIVNDVLDFSKVEAGQVELEDVRFELAEVVREAVEVIALKSNAKGLRSSYRISDDVPAHLIGDPDRLRQVLLNLLGNAVKFTERGEISVLVSANSDERSQGLLHFVVADTGIGIPSERVSSIFDSFTQADVSTSRKFGGTGLGLTISKSFVELMGGRIWVESELGKGTQMHFTAKFGLASLEPIEVPPIAAPIPASRGTLRILLADDSEDNRFVIRGYLKDTGYSIDEAENGQIAVDKFKQGSYDVVLTDVEMPVMDGLSATREIRAYEKQRGLTPTPILALTSHAFKEAIERSVVAGCTSHLTKPIRKATLLEALRPYQREPLMANQPSTSIEPWLKAIIPSYLEKRRNDIAKLRSAVERHDYSTVRMVGHQLAGTGASYGFEAITELGSALEESANAGDVGRMQSEIEQLDSYLRRVQLEG